MQVSSLPYLKPDTPSLLDANIPAITRAYVESRLEAVAAAAAEAQAAAGANGGGAGAVSGSGAGTLDELLGGEEAMHETMEAMPYLCR